MYTDRSLPPHPISAGNLVPASHRIGNLIAAAQPSKPFFDSIDPKRTSSAVSSSKTLEGVSVALSPL